MAVYGFVWLIFRLSGKRSLSQITTFDFVLLLIISETTQQAMVADDNSMTNSFLLITTFFVVDIGLSLVKKWVPQTQALLDGEPLLVFAAGRPIERHMAKERIDEDDIRAAAREKHGLRGLADVQYAVLECDGEISVIPKAGAKGS
jgi:uncharacterized membrane protein YcaP (DUF421 family)